MAGSNFLELGRWPQTQMDEPTFLMVSLSHRSSESTCWSPNAEMCCVCLPVMVLPEQTTIWINPKCTEKKWWSALQCRGFEIRDACSVSLWSWMYWSVNNWWENKWIVSWQHNMLSVTHCFTGTSLNGHQRAVSSQQDVCVCAATAAKSPSAVRQTANTEHSRGSRESWLKNNSRVLNNLTTCFTSVIWILLHI